MALTLSTHTSLIFDLDRSSHAGEGCLEFSGAPLLPPMIDDCVRMLLNWTVSRIRWVLSD